MDPTEIDFVAANHASPAASFFLGVLVSLCGGGALVALLFARARALGQQTLAEVRAAESPSDLEPGPRKMVRGVVEPTDNQEIAVRVEIDQVAKNHTSKNNHWHTWEETGRRTMARPFYLLTERGETVLVEPGEDAFVIDDMQTTHAGCPKMGRRRYCDVERGETFSAYGTLERGPNPRGGGGYRDGTGLVLRAPPRERMYLASASLKDRYTARIRFMRLWGLVAAPIFLLFHTFLTAPYLAASFFGERAPGEVVHHRTWVTHGKNSTTTHYAVTVVTDTGARFEREVSRDTYGDLVRYEGSREKIPTVVYDGLPGGAFLGDRPTLNGAALAFGLAGGGVAIVVFLVKYRSKKAWYDRPKLSEHGGAGHYYGL